MGMVSDVPVWSYLSGGMDSGSITAVAARQVERLTTFTGGFDLTSASGLEVGFDERRTAEVLANLFKTEHLLDKVRRLRLTQDRRYQAAGFRHNLIAGHRILCCAAHRVHSLAEMGSVGELDIDHRHPPRQKTLELLVGDKLHLGPLAKDRRILHARVLVR